MKEYDFVNAVHYRIPRQKFAGVPFLLLYALKVMTNMYPRIIDRQSKC